MGNNGFWTILAIVLIGFATFGVALAFMAPNNADRPAEPPPAVAAKHADAPPVMPAAMKVEPPPAPKAPVAKEPLPEPPPRPLVLGRWQIPGDPASDGKGTQDDFSIRELYFDPTGKRLVAVSPRAAHCLDIVQGKIVGSVYPDVSWAKLHHPRMVFSQEGRVAAVPRENGKDLDLYELASGRRLFSYHLPDQRGRFSFSDGHIAFSTIGDSLIAMVDCHGPVLHTFSTQTGVGKTLSIPGYTAKNDTAVGYLYAPEQGALVVCHFLGNDWNANPSGLGVLDLSSGQERPLTALSFRPSSWDRDLSMKLSPDGTRLVVKGSEGELQVCDWRANQLLFKHAAGGEYQDPGFTPDGQFLLACWHNVLHGRINGVVFTRYMPSRVKLFDLAQQEEVGTFIPQEHDFPHGPTAVAVSPDGRTMAVATQRVVGLIDFEEAFGVPPRPAGSRARQQGR
jgi:hypothetical protein